MYEVTIYNSWTCEMIHRFKEFETPIVDVTWMQYDKRFYI